MPATFPMQFIYIALPEVFLAISSLLLVVYGVFCRRYSAEKTGLLAIVALLLTVALTVDTNALYGEAFWGSFISSGFTATAKVMMLLGVLVVMLLSLPIWRSKEHQIRFEYPLLILLSSLGMMLMISAGDMLSLYMGLELASLSMYILASIKRDDDGSAEAGMKYFVLGAAASGLLLFGISLIYGFTGSIYFDGIAVALAQDTAHPSAGALVGMVLILTAIAFKLSAAPFHLWTPDVYQGAPTAVTALFAVAPKIAFMTLLIRVLFEGFLPVADAWQQIIFALSVASMVWGSVAAINQTDIKRLLAYSSIGHIGYALMGVAALTNVGLAAVLVYLAIYMVMSAGAFACVLMMRRDGEGVTRIADLTGLARQQPRLAFILAALMFSMAGIPPLAGFFGKMAVFLGVVEAGLYWLAVVGALASVVGAYYYLRVIKIMYLDAPAEKPLDSASPWQWRVVAAGSGAFVLLFVLFPGVAFDLARFAVSHLGVF